MTTLDRTALIAECAAAARATIAARDAAVNSRESGRAWLDAQERWAAAERACSAATEKALEGFRDAQ